MPQPLRNQISLPKDSDDFRSVPSPYLDEGPPLGAALVAQDWNELYHREELVKAIKVLHALGYSDFAGHISYRLGRDKILAKPRWVNWRTLTVDDIAMMRDDGTIVGVGGYPFLEWPIHTQIYLRPHPTARCVLHLHLKKATLVASLRIHLEPLTRDLFHFNQDVPRFSNTDYLGGPSWGWIWNPALGNQLAAELGDGKVILQPYHGVDIAASEVGASVVVAHLLERAADAMLTGATYHRRRPIIPPAILAEMTAAAYDPEHGWPERWAMLQQEYL